MKTGPDEKDQHFIEKMNEVIRAGFIRFTTDEKTSTLKYTIK